MEKVTDILGVGKVIDPIAKLCEVVGKAIGDFYDPIKRNRIANSDAKTIDIISEKIRNNNDVQISYDNDHLKISAPDNDFLERITARDKHQAMIKQQNTENVIDFSYNILSNEDTVSEEELDNDWIYRFFNIVENISNEDMQLIWGRILAGEIKQPKSFSLRTLDILKNMTKEEAELFSKFSNFLITFNNSKYDFIDLNIDSYTSDIILLSEIGVINQLSRSIEFKYTSDSKDLEPDVLSLQINDYLIHIYTKNKSPIKLNAYTLSKSGIELYSIIEKKVDLNYLKTLRNTLLENTNIKDIKLAKITKIIDDIVESELVEL